MRHFDSDPGFPRGADGTGIATLPALPYCRRSQKGHVVQRPRAFPEMARRPIFPQRDPVHLRGRIFKMRMRHALLASVCLTFVLAANVDLSLAQGASALTGVVTSEQEGPMEGVLVTAKKAGSTIATTVVTNKEGRYSFPASRLEPGEYTIKIRAAGYDLDGKGAAQVPANKPATADLKLKKTRNLSAQPTTAEWLQSMPGTPKQKDGVLNCVSCHTVERIVRSTHNAEEFIQVQKRMGTYANQSVPTRVQKRLAERLMEERGDNRNRAQEERAEYMASI